MSPTIADLTARLLAAADDFGFDPVEDGDVTPHDASLGHRTEPRLAWKHAASALTAAGVFATNATPPSAWANLVARQAPAAWLPFAAGNYPQRVRDLTQVLHPINATVPAGAAPSGLEKWATSQTDAAKVIAAGVCRSAGAYELCERLLNEAAEAPAEVIANERAALLWEKGQRTEAAAVWAKLDTVPARFNRGLASLANHDAERAKVLFAAVQSELPESDPWHHLAGLYLTVAELQG